MLDLLLIWPAVVAILGISFVAATCCGGPASKHCYNPSSMDVDGAGRGTLNIDGETHRSRKLQIIDAENVNNDVKVRRAKSREKSIEDENHKYMQRKKYRETVTDAVGRRRRSIEAEEDRMEKKARKRKSADARERDAEVKKEDRRSRGRKKTTEREKDKKATGTREGTDADESIKDSKTTDGNDSKRGKPPTESGDKMATNETMASRNRMDEMNSAKEKNAAADALLTAHTPAIVSAETQIDSEKPKKSKASPTPKTKRDKKKEEEVRLWNEAIARGNVFRPRKDDETIDEVNVDWNN